MDVTTSLLDCCSIRKTCRQFVLGSFLEKQFPGGANHNFRGRLPEIQLTVPAHVFPSLQPTPSAEDNSCFMASSEQVICTGDFEKITAIRTSIQQCWDGVWHYNSCPILFDNLKSLWLGTIESISAAAIFNDLLLKNCCSQRQTLHLVSGLLHSFVTVF